MTIPSKKDLHQPYGFGRSRRSPYMPLMKFSSMTVYGSNVLLAKEPLVLVRRIPKNLLWVFFYEEEILSIYISKFG